MNRRFNLFACFLAFRVLLPLAAVANVETSDDDISRELERIQEKTSEYMNEAEAAEEYFFQKYQHLEFQEYKAMLLEARDRFFAQFPLVANIDQLMLLKKTAFQFYGLCSFYADMQNELGRFIADKDPFVKKGELTEVRFWIKYRLPFYKALQEWVVLKIDFFERAQDGFQQAVIELEIKTRENSQPTENERLIS